MITKDMTIGEMVQQYPSAAEVLMGEGVHCVGCGAAHFETIEQGLSGHGKTQEEIAEEEKAPPTKEDVDNQLAQTTQLLAETENQLIVAESELSDARYTVLKQADEIIDLDNAVSTQANKIRNLNTEICDLNVQINPDYDC